MFWTNFYNECEKRGTKPLPVVNELHIAAGNITKWKNGTIPNGENLMKISNYFGCSIDYLLGRETSAPLDTYTPDEQAFIESYRSLDSSGKDKLKAYLSDMLQIHGIHIQDIPGGYAFSTEETTISPEDLASVEKTEKNKAPK